MRVLAAVAGWYEDGSGHQRWWDGFRWTEYLLPERPEVRQAPVHGLGQSNKTSPAGWCVDGNGVNRWWDGSNWGQPAQAFGAAYQDLGTLTFSMTMTRLVLLVSVCFLFTLGGIVLLASGTIVQIMAGLISIGLFGVVGFVAVRKLWRQRTVLTLTRDGLRPQVGGFIPWGDFDAVGTARIGGGPMGGTKVIGIRLKRYENYLASFTPDQLKLILQGAKWGRVGGFAMLSQISPEDIAVTVSKLEISELDPGGLLSIPQKDVAAILKWAHDHSGGWDVTFSPLLFDRSSDRVVQEISSYHQAVLNSRPQR